jgi:trk system potassium uptake protein TrkH
MNLSRIRFVLYVDGVIVLLVAATMLVPMSVDFANGNPDWSNFALSAAISAFVAVSLIISCRGTGEQVDRKSGYLLTVSAWLLVGAFASLPLHLSSLNLSFTDAFFETMSGLTTTGSTVIAGLDKLPPGLLLWRSLLQWIGGVGIVVMAIVLLPALGVGGMQLFHTESSDISGKPVSKAFQLAAWTVGVYVGLSVLCAIAYALAGMTVFDAINHAMGTISTGGFSTKDKSIGFYDSVPIEAVSILFMISGALPLIWYARIFLEGKRALLQDRQVPMLLIILAVAVVLVTEWNIWANDLPTLAAFRTSAYNVTSILTDTGFATSDFSTWGSFAVGTFFALYFIGGSAGSTSGAIKIFRWQILVGGVRRQLSVMLSPHRIILNRYGDQPVDDEMVESVRNFFFMYLLTFFVISLLVMATGLDFLSSTSAVAQAMANAGPGLGPTVGPAANFGGVPDSAKWLLVGAMLLGRLELSTIYVLLMRDYWRV